MSDPRFISRAEFIAKTVKNGGSFVSCEFSDDIEILLYKIREMLHATLDQSRREGYSEGFKAGLIKGYKGGFDSRPKQRKAKKPK